MYKKIYLLVFISVITTTVSLAQENVDINFNGLGFLDNREYKAIYSPVAHLFGYPHGP